MWQKGVEPSYETYLSICDPGQEWSTRNNATEKGDLVNPWRPTAAFSPSLFLPHPRVHCSSIFPCARARLSTAHPASLPTAAPAPAPSSTAFSGQPLAPLLQSLQHLLLHHLRLGPPVHVPSFYLALPRQRLESLLSTPQSTPHPSAPHLHPPRFSPLHTPCFISASPPSPPHTAPCTTHSTLYTPRSAISTWRSTLRAFHRTLHSTISTLDALYPLHSLCKCYNFYRLSNLGDPYSTYSPCNFHNFCSLYKS